jgi:hypothetical protein
VAGWAPVRLPCLGAFMHNKWLLLVHNVRNVALLVTALRCTVLWRTSCCRQAVCQATLCKQGLHVQSGCT